MKMGQQATRSSVQMQLLRHFIFKIIINYLVAYSVVGLICNKLQYFGHLMQGAKTLEKTLTLGKMEEKGAAADEMVGWHH